MGASNISAPISHLTWRRVAASKNRHLLGNSTTGDVKTTCFYRQNVSFKPLLILATLNQEGRPNLITVTDEVAASAKQSLKIQDWPCDPDWNEARWVGFSSPATTDTAFKLDDIEMENR